MKSVGISAAGGVGKATAELIVNGETSFDMYELEVSRFLGLHNNRKFLRDRVKEVPGMHYGINYPYHEFSTGRNLRMSPVYPKLREAGAVFGQVMGYERPTWFNPSQSEDGKFKENVYAKIYITLFQILNHPIGQLIIISLIRTLSEDRIGLILLRKNMPLVAKLLVLATILHLLK